MNLIKYFALAFTCLLLSSCEPSADEKAASQLKTIELTELELDRSPENMFNSQAKMAVLDSSLKTADAHETLRLNYQRARVFMEMGSIDKAIELFNQVHMDPTVSGTDFDLNKLEPELAFAYLRLGEVNNCITNHTAESCIYPIQGGGLHKDPSGSSKAIALYEKILTRTPGNPEAMWLMNIAYMTLGKYP